MANEEWNEIYRVTGKLTSDDNFTHKYFVFEVGKDCDALLFITNYAPKYLYLEEECLALTEKYLPLYLPDGDITRQQKAMHCPLKNHLSWSIDSPRGWLGTAHREFPKQRHVITADGSSDGFAASAITAGEWRLTVSVNAVVTPDIDYEIVVFGLKNGVGGKGVEAVKKFFAALFADGGLEAEQYGMD